MARFFSIIFLILGLNVIGALGLHLIEGDPLIDCFYFTMITLATVGYNDDIISTNEGKLFVMGFIVCGLSIYTYSAFQLGQVVVGVQMRSILERRRMHKEIENLKDHYIVCGYGRMGQTICEYLRQRHQPFIVIDAEEMVFQREDTAPKVLYRIGDAADEETLQAAGIARAKALAAVLPTDADNVYVILSARMQNEKLQIIARAGEERAVEKMTRAGANRVISPYASGAVKMARFMISPSVEDFLEIADSEGNGLELADIQVTQESPYIGMALRDTNLRARGVMVIGIRRSNGERLMPPPGDAVLQVGDCLFAFGTVEAVNTTLVDTEM